jgi:opine dehydrogenase
MTRVAILGAGNGGFAMGAYLSLKGCKVNLYDKFPEVLQPIQRKKSIELKGVLNGSATFDRISTDIGRAIEGCQLIMVVTPAFAHREIAESCARFLEDGQIIVLHPGRTGGALEFYNTVKGINPRVKVIIAEAQTLIYASRKTGPAEVTVYGVKKMVPVAAIPSYYTKEVVCKLNEFYKEFIPARNVLETSLLNIGAILHPAPSILNIARIDLQDDFEYYYQGISPSVAKVLERMDRERMAVAKELGVRTISTIEWLKEVYGVKNGDIYTAVHLNKVYSGIMAPKSPLARYITEDVPMSLTPLSELGKVAGVTTPVIDMMIELASIINNKDYRREGRSLTRMGIEGLSREQLIEYVS